MLQVTNLSKSYGSQEIFAGVTFTVSPGEKVGLIGRNGEGKTTLFRMIMKTEHPDSGDVTTPRGYSIGYLSQNISFVEDTVIAEGCSALLRREDEIDESYRVREILSGLGFGDAQIEASPKLLSGGFQVRLMLAKALISEPNLLLLDEPTNYLDIVSIRWLQRFLREWRGELMIITHDRSFMDSISTHTLGIHRKRVRKVEGKTQKLYEQLEQEEEIYEKTRLNQQKSREHAERFITRFRAQASKAKAVQSRIKQLSKVAQLSELSSIDSLEFSFNAADFPGKTMFEVNHLTFAWPNVEKLVSDESEDTQDALIKDLTFTLGKRDRLAVIGPNGRGKSTLLNLLVGNLKPCDGSIWQSSNVQIAYFGQANIDRLQSDLTVEGEIMAAHPEHSRKLARDICGAMMFEGDLALKSIKVLSGGERARVLLGKLLVQPANLLFLDEPTNHLDMHSIDALIEAIDQFPGSVVIVTHSELILDALATRLLVFDGGQVELFEGNYRDFLARVGWKDENLLGRRSGKSRGSSNSGLSKKEQRLLKAAKDVGLAKKLSPIKRKVKDTEDRIVTLEQCISRDEQSLLLAVERGERTQIASFSSDIHRARVEIEKLFQILEDAARESEEMSQGFGLDK